MVTIYKKELASYFRSPVAYCIMGFFMLIVGYVFWNNSILQGSSKFSDTLGASGVYLTFVIPIITMKLLADERKNGTEILLRTSPVPMWKVIIGKYLSAVTLYLVMLLLTLIYPLMIIFLAEGNGVFAHAQDFSSYLGFFLLGMSYIAVSLFVSSFTEIQSVAAMSGIVSLIVLFSLQYAGMSLGGTVGRVMQWIAPLSRYSDFAVGAFNVASLIFYITFSGMFVFLTYVNVERRRWN